jgi:hypothetical protein
MTTLTRLAKLVSQQVEGPLTSLRLEKREPGTFYFQPTSDVLGFVQMRKSARWGEGYLEINLAVGIRNFAVEEVLGELREADPMEPSLPPLSCNVGYTSPKDRYLPFLFREDKSIDEEIKKLVASVAEFALPFIKRHTDLSTLVERMQSGRGMNPLVLSYHIPVAFYILRRFSEAVNALEETLRTIGEPRDQYGRDFTRFSRNLLNRLDSSR